jgi:hypothetical protein
MYILYNYGIHIFNLLHMDQLWSCHTRGKITEDFLGDFPSEIPRRSKARKQWSTVTRERNHGRFPPGQRIFFENEFVHS